MKRSDAVVRRSTFVRRANPPRIAARIPIVLSLAIGGLLVYLGAGCATDKPAPASASVESKPTTPERKEVAVEVDAKTQAFQELKSAVAKNNRGVMPPGRLSDKDKEWNAEVIRASLVAADLAAKLRKDFPESKEAGEAARIEEQMLFKASMAGSAEAAGRLDTLLAGELQKPGLSEDERFRLRTLQLRAAAMTGDPAGEEAPAARAARQLIQEFPKRSEPYSMLLSSTYSMGPEKTTALIRELQQMPDVPEEAKQQADGILRRTNIKGQPLDLQFTALDGREVDLNKLKGKVVLVDFWATWCGPCVAELPKVKEAYEKFHDQGFEIVAISFDHDKAALEKFVKAKELPWPQYFDGQGWKNKYGVHYGVLGIPMMWLVDREGKVAETDARGHNLVPKIERLLAGSEAASTQPPAAGESSAGKPVAN